MEVGLARLRQDMRWDLYYQGKAEEGEGEGENGEGEEEEVKERRILKDRKRKTNLPTKWSPPRL